MEDMLPFSPKPESLAQEYFKEQKMECPFCHQLTLWGWTEGYEEEMLYNEEGEVIGFTQGERCPTYYICVQCCKEFEFKPLEHPTDEHQEFQQKLYKILRKQEEKFRRNERGSASLTLKKSDVKGFQIGDSYFIGEEFKIREDK